MTPQASHFLPAVLTAPSCELDHGNAIHGRSLTAMGDLRSTSADSLTMLRNATWTLSNLCRGKPPPRWELIAPTLPALVQLIHQSDEEVVADACWALSHLCEPADCIQHLIVVGVLPRLVTLLGHTSPNVQTPALRCIGNVTTGTSEQTQAVLAAGALPMLMQLLACAKREIKKEACWMISNVAAGAAQHIEAVCASGVVPQLLQIVAREEFDTKKEAAYALCNACIGGTPSIVSGLVSLDVLPTLCSLLDNPDTDLLLLVCDAINAVLAAAADTDPANGVISVVEAIEAVGGCDKLEALQMHQNSTVYQRVVRLMETYFGAADADPALLPASQAGGFSFGLPAATSTATLSWISDSL